MERRFGRVLGQQLHRLREIERAEPLNEREGKVQTGRHAGPGRPIAIKYDALVNLDGNAIANAIAERLVLYARRPGYQSQFSPVLTAQSHADAPFAELIQWIRDNLAGRLEVPRLAARVSMSERTFLRTFTRSVGVTPARFVETLRLDQARVYLAAGMQLKEIATEVGYLAGAQLPKVFERRFGMAPSLFRELHH